MTAPLLAALLVLGSTSPDCTRLSSLAKEAYAAARQQTDETGGAVQHLRAARDCMLQRSDTSAAAVLHVQEIYLLSLSGAGRAYQQSVEDFFALFHPHHALTQYTWVMRKQAALEAARGNAARAFVLLHRCLTMTLPTRPAERAETHLRIAEVHKTLSQYEEARGQILQAQALIERHMRGADRERQRVRLLINLGEMLLQWHALESPSPAVLEQARQAAEQAYALQEYATASDRIHVQHLLGDVLTYAGEGERAALLLGKAVEQSRQGEQYEYLLALYRLGRNRLRGGDLAGARRALQAAFVSALDQGDLTWAGRIRHDQGRLERRAGNVAGAKAHFREAIDLIESIRSEIGTSEWAAASVSNWQAPYRGLAQVLAEQDSLAAALKTLELSRARHLSALQARFSRMSSLQGMEAAHADSLLGVLADVRNRLYKASGAHADSLRATAASVQIALDRVVGLPPPQTPLDVAALQRSLRADGRAVLYYVLDRADRLFEDEQVAYALVVRADTIALQRLPFRPEELPPRLAAVGPALRGDTEAAGSAARAFSLDALHALYQDLFEPVAHLLPSGTPLTLIPDGALFAVPFSALVTRPAGRYDYGRASYLLDRHPLTVDLSLKPAAPSAGSATEMLAIGKSRFDGMLPALAPLPGVPAEIKAATRSFRQARTLRDADATYSRFAEQAPRSKVIHFATHALLDDTSPLYHALVLTPASGSDGLLYLHEIETLHLEADLVTLSGCNTARGNLRAGEGMAGLQYAFRAVGARSTVSTLWNLSDAAAAELIETFYRHLARGTPKDVALQRAQQAFRQKHPDASPFLWAAPVLYGSAAPLAPQATPSRLPLLVLLGGALAAFLLWRKRRLISQLPHATLPPL